METTSNKTQTETFKIVNEWAIELKEIQKAESVKVDELQSGNYMLTLTLKHFEISIYDLSRIERYLTCFVNCNAEIIGFSGNIIRIHIAIKQ